MTLAPLLDPAPGLEARSTHALVLMGGGARTAYQAGVLRALGQLLRERGRGASAFPFRILIGTSAGAMNAAYLAGAASAGIEAFDQLAQFWLGLRSESVYQMDAVPWARLSRLLAAARLFKRARQRGAVLNTMPLVDTLHRQISLPGIEQALRDGAIEALAVTASSYTTGVHWTFCHTGADSQHRSWREAGRCGEFQPVTIDHLLASAAIPFLFPAIPLWVDEHCEYFGDGSMRQVSPLSPAVRLGADRILVIGVGQPQRAGYTAAASREPGFGAIAGHALASVFHDTLHGDVEQARRVTQALAQMPAHAAAALPYRPLDILAIQPSQSLDAIAREHLRSMPHQLRAVLQGVGALAAGAPLASYLMFEPAFTRDLMALGERDARAREAELLAFLTPMAAGARA